MHPALEKILSRFSVKMVHAPGPSDEELALILQSAMTAPDHGSLVPWRIKIIRGEAIRTFTDLALEIRQKERPADPEKIEATRQWLYDVPLILSVFCYIDYNNVKISEQDRVLATACAMQQILNACHALGYGAFWASGLATGLSSFQSAMGCDALDHRDMGYIVIGTPKYKVPLKKRDSYGSIASVWTGPADS